MIVTADVVNKYFYKSHIKYLVVKLANLIVFFVLLT